MLDDEHLARVHSQAQAIGQIFRQPVDQAPDTVELDEALKSWLYVERLLTQLGTKSTAAQAYAALLELGTFKSSISAVGTFGLHTHHQLGSLLETLEAIS